MSAPELVLMAAVEISDGKAAYRKKEHIQAARDFGDPVADAKAWVEQGASWVHVADLDAANGTGSNPTVVRDVCHAVHGRARIQRAGGIRSVADIQQALHAKADRVVVDSAALGEADLDAMFNDRHQRVVAAVDVHAGALWAPGSSVDGAALPEVLARLKAAGCPGYVLTDIDHEGTRKGPDHDLITAVSTAVQSPLCIAGGVARLEHLHDLATMRNLGVFAVVLDAALYQDYFSVAEAIAAVEPRFDPYQWGPAQPWGMTQGL